MNKLTHLSQKSIELMETIWVTFWARLVIVFLATLLAVLAGSSSALNPCFGFLYEEPYNHRVLAPQTYPPHAMTQQLLAQAQSPNQLKECWYANGSSYSIAYAWRIEVTRSPVCVACP
ncbi:hypothetical protein [Scytonema sp. PCC 10023]|uniref:hypothetical protein n=1 Tax=Scytonema sp. PCC 10023 TaxID=1680591 RepID=UPI0039C704A8